MLNSQLRNSYDKSDKEYIRRRLTKKRIQEIISIRIGNWELGINSLNLLKQRINKKI